MTDTSGMLASMELVSIPENPIPSNAFAGSITTPDGVALRYARWRTTARKQRGTVCIVQGRSEFIEKYFETITELRRRGFGVMAFDLRGQGGSQRLLPDRRRGHVDDFMDYVTDIRSIVRDVMTPHMPKPWFALSHSMGSAALLLALDEGDTGFERAVMLAPLIGLADLKLPGLARAAASTLDFFALGTRYIPGGGATALSTKPFAGNRLTSDPVRYARISSIFAVGPHLALGDPTIRWTQAMFQTFQRFENREFGRHISVPTLMMIPGADPLCSSPASEALAMRLRACQPIVIPGARHEILMERDYLRSQFFAAFDSFIPGQTSVDDLVDADDESEAGTASLAA
ncbi:MAG: alpha/beta fold hydrolase [Beijerinckiaceae bacterium]